MSSYSEVIYKASIKIYHKSFRIFQRIIVVVKIKSLSKKHERQTTGIN